VLSIVHQKSETEQISAILFPGDAPVPLLALAFDAMKSLELKVTICTPTYPS